MVNAGTSGTRRFVLPRSKPRFFGRGGNEGGGRLADRRVALHARLGPLGLLGSIRICCSNQEHQHARSGSSHQVHADLASTARRCDGPHGFVRGLASVPSLPALRVLRGECWDVWCAAVYSTTEGTEIFGRGAHGDGGTLADRRVALRARLGPLGLLGSTRICCSPVAESRTPARQVRILPPSPCGPSFDGTSTRRSAWVPPGNALRALHVRPPFPPW